MDSLSIVGVDSYSKCARAKMEMVMVVVEDDGRCWRWWQLL